MVNTVLEEAKRRRGGSQYWTSMSAQPLPMYDETKEIQSKFLNIAQSKTSSIYVTLAI